jgi:pSer/pThr/pTyr-binding forkhead associated (FHA) protein
VVLDLSPDQKVSRLHGRIWEENGAFWIEDLKSSRGTQINGVEIKGKGRQLTSFSGVSQTLCLSL